MMTSSGPGIFFFWSCLSSSCLHQQLGDPGGDAEAEEYLNARITHHDGICFSCIYLEYRLVLTGHSDHTRIPKTVCIVITIPRYL